MNDQNDLSDALAQNGSFDPARANEVREKALGAFEASLRKVERWLMAYLCLCCWLIVFTLFLLLHAATTKSIVMYGLLFLVFFETTILLKLWYWTMNNKISVLKAIKLMELRQSAAAADSALPAETDTFRGPLKSISSRERVAWWAAIVVGCAAIGAIKGSETPWASGNRLVHDGIVTLAADGSGAAETDLSIVNDSFDALGNFNFNAPAGLDVRFLNGEGRELPFTASQPPGSEHIRYDVELDRWIMPGRRLSYTRVEQAPRWAEQDQGLWTYTNDYLYGYDTIDFRQTVVLPPGAGVVAATPWPVTVYTLAGQTALVFEATRGRNERFKYSVQYRLPTDTEAADGT